MLSESLRRRLETLNRDRLPSLPAKAKGAARETSSPQQAPAKKAEPTAPVDLLGLGEECENAAGRHLVIRVPVDELWSGGEQRVAQRLAHLGSLGADELNPATAPLIAALPDRAVLLDLETCGLSGSALFLVGLLREVNARLAVELLFARTYAEERAVMVSLWDRLAGADAIASFNGKSFDWPMVMDRSRRYLLHKSRELVEPAHVDVLHAARRRWKGQLPDCKLQTIERLVCRRARTGDIPGSQIPAAYDAYVRTGRPQEMQAVLHHNALDLVTLLDIAMRVAS